MSQSARAPYRPSCLRMISATSSAEMHHQTLAGLATPLPGSLGASDDETWARRGSSPARTGGKRAAGAAGRPASYRAVMTTPAMEERIMELMPEDAKAVLLLLARQLPYETGKAIDAITGRRSTLR